MLGALYLLTDLKKYIKKNIYCYGLYYGELRGDASRPTNKRCVWVGSFSFPVFQLK